MALDVDAFVDRWVYDIEHKLYSELEALRDDLYSDDEQTRQEATREVSEVLQWLPRRPSVKGHSNTVVLRDNTPSKHEAKRHRGRPRTAAGYAVTRIHPSPYNPDVMGRDRAYLATLPAYLL